VLAHAQRRDGAVSDATVSDAAVSDPAFTACVRLFRDHPLAVRRHYAEHRYGSMVLVNRATGTARFFVVIMERDEEFVLRPWDRRDWARVVIRPDEPVSGDVRRLIESSTPVPCDGALLGWVTGRQVRAVAVVRGRLSEPWEDASAVPDIVVLPRAGTQPDEWPPLTAKPLEDGRLWEYVGRGQLADLTPLVSRRPGRVFLVPAADARGRRACPRVVVTERLGTSDFWVPAGVYADHWTLREGAVVPPAAQLLALPGVVDLARGCYPGGAAGATGAV
jgi:hypothetical protein